MNTVFCIECQEMVELQRFPFFGNLHDRSLPVFGDSGEVVGVDYEACHFPLGYTFSAPPELPADWMEHVGLPEEEEVEFEIGMIELTRALEAAV